MTSTLLRLSIAARLLRLLDGLGHHLGIRLEPVRDPHPLAAAHLPDLHQAAALVVGGRDLERRHEASEVKPLICSKPRFTSSPVILPSGRAFRAFRMASTWSAPIRTPRL